MAVGGAAAAATVSRSVPGLFTSRRTIQQTTIIRELCTKYITDEALRELAYQDDVPVTSNEHRGISRCVHGHLGAALDTLNTYGRERRAKSRPHIVGIRAGMSRTYKQDPRTRFVELLKVWLRKHAQVDDLQEEVVRRMYALCREMLNQQVHFPARNERSFIKTIGEVYEHLEQQLEHVLERDKACAELAGQVRMLAENLISDSIAYLMVGLTDLKYTDKLPSLQVQSMWAALPVDAHPIRKVMDPKMQKSMRDVWTTDSGALVAGLLRNDWCVRVFHGTKTKEAITDLAAESTATPRSGSSRGTSCSNRGGEKSPRRISFSPRRGSESSGERSPRSLSPRGGEITEYQPTGTTTVDVLLEIDRIKAKWCSAGSMQRSGLAGAFRKPDAADVRDMYVETVKILLQLITLIGQPFVHFQQIAASLGDYGMIRVHQAFHPFLSEVCDKVMALNSHLEGLNKAVDKHLVIKHAKQYKVEKPVPSQSMMNRAHEVINRAVLGDASHAKVLLQTLEQLRQKSDPNRLPDIARTLEDACMQIDTIYSTAEFMACVNHTRFAEVPKLQDLAQPQCLHGPAPASSVQIVEPPDSGDIYLDMGDATDHTGLRSSGEASPKTSSDCNAPRSGTHALPRALPHIALPAQAGSFPSGLPQQQTHMDSNPFSAEVGHATGDKNPFSADAASPTNPFSPTSAGPAAERPRPPACLHASVVRLTASTCGPGLRHHDRRALVLKEGMLDVYDKGSTSQVKTRVDVQAGVEECLLLPGRRRLALSIRRCNQEGSGVFQTKNYAFEFASVEEASKFHCAISNLQHA